MMPHKHFLSIFIGTTAILLASITATLAVLDPFDTGRLTPFKRTGMYEKGPRTSNPSRMRDSVFDAAIIGNSTSQLLNPERLNAHTGLRFVQLSTPGTGPMEQVAIAAHLFRERRAGIKVIIMNMDTFWCDASLEQRVQNPFPFWLYDGSDLVYLKGLVRMSSVEALYRRIRLLLGREKRARADGFWDYEPEWLGQNTRVGEIEASNLARPAGTRGSASIALRQALDLMPGETIALLLHPPTFSPPSHQLSSASEDVKTRCKAEIAALAATRPRTAVVDQWIDEETTRDPAQFFDFAHYRTGLAKVIETAVARQIKALQQR
jgi:hypothetical protein